MRPRLAMITWLAGVAAGCMPNYRADDRYIGDNYVELAAAGSDVEVRLRGHVGRADLGASSAPRLVADVDRCRVVEDDDGLSRLDYPAGPAAPPRPHVRMSVTLEATPTTDGSLALVRPADKPDRFSQSDNVTTLLLSVPVFVVRPLEVLPDRLASALTGRDPAAPAVVELARDLVECRAVAVAGSVRGVGDFAAQMSLTDAGRAKLRAALARHDAATRPAALGSTGLRPATRYKCTAGIAGRTSPVAAKPALYTSRGTKMAGGRTRSLLALAVLVTGCTATVMVRNDRASFESPDVTTELSLRSRVPQHLDADVLVSDADVDGLRLTRDAGGMAHLSANGWSRAFRPPRSTAFPLLPSDGSVAGFDPLAEPAFGLFSSNLPAFVVAPLSDLPDQLVTVLNDPQPPPPDVIRLTRDWTAFQGLAILGEVHNAGLFAATLTLTDAGRAKLRAALARHDAATRPATRPTAGLPAAGR